MQDTINCPICKTSNSNNASCCINCGQRFKPIEVSIKSIRSTQKTNERKSKGKLHYVSIFLVICFLAYFCFPKQINSIIVNIMPQKIASVKGVASTVKEDSAGTLPGSVINRIDDCTVNNSIVELNVTTPSSSKWIWISIKKGTDKKDVIIPVNNDILNTKIYLPFNSGEYKIDLKNSSNIDKKQGYYSWKNFKVNNKDNRDMQFLLPDEYVESDSAEIIKLASNIVSGLNTYREKTLAIHDYVASNISYDTEAYFNKRQHQYSALETLSGKKAVCNGYANLTAALNRAVGIKTKIVGGTAWSPKNQDPEGHAWNETYVDGKWLIQDTTWDAGGIEEVTEEFKFQLSHEFFDPSASDFEKNHHKDKEW